MDGSYHFRRERLVDPFMTAGYSLFFNDTGSFFATASQPHLSLFNVGAGMNLWFSHHLGSKLEIRD
jgi:hypothetical protein